MSRAKRKSWATTAGAAAAAQRPKLQVSPDWWKKLKASSKGKSDSLNRGELVFILRNLATLTDSGVSLPKALGTLAEEHTLEKHRDMLLGIRRHLENGESFSGALTHFGNVFDRIMINQIKVGEHSGTLPDTLSTIATHFDQANQLRAEIIRKLSYPIVLSVAGSCVITFLLMYVVPVFQDTYDDAGVPLPFITQLLIQVGDIFKGYAWLVAGAAVIATVVIKQLRKRSEFALKMDRTLLRLPVLGNWLRDMAVLRLVEILGHLMEAGFTLADALGEAVQAINNRAVQQGVKDLQSAVQRGEKFSREIERHGELFPPIVSQLVIVGEQTGNLGNATKHICEHLEREIRRKTNLFVGTIEPVLTIGLAGAVAMILLAIYLPMFDMINVVGH